MIEDLFATEVLTDLNRPIRPQVIFALLVLTAQRPLVSTIAQPVKSVFSKAHLNHLPVKLAKKDFIASVVQQVLLHAQQDISVQKAHPCMIRTHRNQLLAITMSLVRRSRQSVRLEHSQK